MTREQIEIAFKKEFQTPLDKYEADIPADEHWFDYPASGRDIKMIVELPGDLKIDLGECVSPTKK